MEANGQTGFEFSDGKGRVLKACLSESVSESVAQMVGKVNPQPILMALALGVCLYVGTNPETRKQLAFACSRWLSSAV